MISHISIKDFAIIEDLQLDLNDGLNIITGETGAGKSIIIEALSLALGARADTSYIRTGKEKAVIQIIADYGDEEVIITREISSNGRNICRIDGQIVNLSELMNLCSKIADIHGQYDHQSLLNPENHITLIDLYDRVNISPAKDETSKAYEEYKSVSYELSSLISDYNTIKRQKDFMQYELNEIESASLIPGEDIELEEKINLLSNSEKIFTALEGAYSLLYDSDANVSSALSRAGEKISQVSSYSSDLKKAEEEINNIVFSLEDIASLLRNTKEQAVYNPHELDECISRMDLIENLKKKYSPDIEDILKYADELSEKLLKADNLDSEKELLENKKKEAEEKLIISCKKLSSLRKDASLRLCNEILFELQDLNFKDANITVDFKESDSFTASGNDIVEFMITTNKGEKLKPLSKVASGGEMSRIMLAFKKITGDYDKIPTMVFDEIDTGISGITASIVAKKMVQISENHQVICITHLPQIAAAGLHNYLIKKDVHDESTFTDIIPLDNDGKIDEISRLLGGINITDTTRKTARELINAARSK